MATSVSGMSTIDVNSIVSQLMTVERQPLQAISKTLSSIQTKLSAFGKLQSQLSAFQDAARNLKDLQTWQAARATSADETAIKATAAPGALTGNYSLLVERLAHRQTVASTPFLASDAVVGAGSMTIQLGTFDADLGSFSADVERPAVAVTIPVDATVAQVRDAINAADAGVTASLVNDGSGVRLMIRSSTSGAENAFRIDVSGGAGLTALAFDPAAAGATSMEMTEVPQDARALINGLEVNTPTNKLDGVIENMIIDLRKEGETAIDVDVSPDTEALREAVQKFVSAWNDLNKTIADQTRYDPATKTAGTLQGNGTVVALQRQLRSVMSASVDGSTLARLSDAGIELQRDGSLSIKDSRFNAAAADPAKLQALFATNGTGVNDVGIARRFDALITSLLGVDGSLTAATETLLSRQTNVNKQQDAFEQRMTLIETRLRRQYTALDAQLAQMSNTSAFLASKFSQS